MIHNRLALLPKALKMAFLSILFIMMPAAIFASSGEVPSLGPVRIEFIIFGLILLGVALFHKQTFWVALSGLATGRLGVKPGPSENPVMAERD